MIKIYYINELKIGRNEPEARLNYLFIDKATELKARKNQSLMSSQTEKNKRKCQLTYSNINKEEKIQVLGL